MKNIIGLFILLASFSAMANGIKCSKDSRPSDGSYKEVKLLEDQGGYKLTSTTITAGYGAPVQSKASVLAEGLNCNIDGLVAYCFKSRTALGEVTNSVVKFQVVDRNELNSLSQTEAKKSPSIIEIEVVSPLTAGLRKNFSFRVTERFGSGGCLEL